MKKVAIVQSNYIPWKGYFDLIAAVDEFILFDDMQYTRRDWRNRNKIKGQSGLQWLTVPVNVKGKFDQKIRDTEINDRGWSKKHWQALLHNYKKAPFFGETKSWVEPLYQRAGGLRLLSDLNRHFLEAICGYLGIGTKISWSWDYPMVDGKSERLAGLCKAAGGTEYISGPSAKDYIDESVFKSVGIALRWFDYSAYPQYPQCWDGFEHGVTILDLLFNCGKEANQYLKYA